MIRARISNQSVVATALALVAPAESAFRSRWRLSTLARVDAALHEALCEQIALYDAALMTGSDDDIEIQAAAMVRGWRAACARMEAPAAPGDHDAYLEGWDSATGLRVVIGNHKGSAEHAEASNRVVFVTPDEVAKLIAGQEMVAAVKLAFPGAEVIGPDD